VAFDQTLIVQVPDGSALQRQLRQSPPPEVSDGSVVVETAPTDPEGVLEALSAGQIVLAVPSPETLAHETRELDRVLGDAGTGEQPLVVVVEAAEELRDDELRAVLDASRRATRPVILRVMRGA